MEKFLTFRHQLKVGSSYAKKRKLQVLNNKNHCRMNKNEVKVVKKCCDYGWNIPKNDFIVPDIFVSEVEREKLIVMGGSTVSVNSLNAKMNSCLRHIWTDAHWREYFSSPKIWVVSSFLAPNRKHIWNEIPCKI